MSLSYAFHERLTLPVLGCLCLCSIAPHVVFTLVFLEALPKFEKKFGL
jgi:hypothetical protein